MRDALWTKDWCLALAYSLFFLILAYGLIPGRFDALERPLYDLGLRAQARVPSDRIAIVAIDEDSLAHIGPMPWPRPVHADVIEQLRRAGALTVASTLFHPESRDEPGVKALAELAEALAQSPLTLEVPARIDTLQQRVAEVEALRERLEAQRPPLIGLAPLRALGETWSQSALATQVPAELGALRERLEQARRRLAADDTLAPALRRHGAVLLPMQLAPGAAPQGESASPLREDVRRFALNAPAGLSSAPNWTITRLPQPELGAAAAGVGALQFAPDGDGVVRVEALALRQSTQWLPSLAVLTAATAQGLRPNQIELRPGRGLRLGKALLRTSPPFGLRTHFYDEVDGRPPFAIHSFHAVRAGAVAPEALRDKIVLIGVTAAAQVETFATPVSAHTPPVLMLAHTVSSLLKGHYIVAPAWGRGLGLAAALLGAAYLAAALPLLAPVLAAGVSAGLVAVLLLTQFYLLAVGALWVPLMMPALLIGSGHLALLAWRQRPGSVAPAVAGTRDRPAAATLRAANAAANGALPAAPAPNLENTVLGRYQVERELGQGAMGKVYVGHDPKIGRRVAIKTMALSADFASDDRVSVKARFFREAEAAGSLSHPHIVQIFDAGEEQDLAYIAMEFIQGHDLARHTKPHALLPVAEVLRYVADAADALDYAHQRNIVHRDIKPANLMLVEATKTIKVTDFGVARVTDASKTRTGMVLGTPSYMSPEQLSGKKVDGRSDLFSLGVTLYQLLTGKLPFQAESLATLMFKIANEAPMAMTAVRSDLPVALNAIVDKALQKSLDTRYARASDLARDLRRVLATLT